MSNAANERKSDFVSTKAKLIDACAIDNGIECGAGEAGKVGNRAGGQASVHAPSCLHLGTQAWRVRTRTVNQEALALTLVRVGAQRCMRRSSVAGGCWPGLKGSSSCESWVAGEDDARRIDVPLRVPITRRSWSPTGPPDGCR